MNLNTVATALIARVTGVDVNTATKQALYTVPTGKTLIVTGIVVRNVSTSLTTASFGFGFNANADDVLASEVWTELTGSTLYTCKLPKEGAIVGAASDVLGSKCTINQGAAATVTIEIYGILF